METARKIASNTFAQVGAKFINAFLSVIIVRLITGYMAEAGYGRYTLAYEFVAFFGIAIDLGLFTILVDRMSKERERIPEILGNFLSLRILLVVSAALLASAAVFLMPEYDMELKVAVMISAVSIGLNLVSITLSSVLQVYLKMISNAIALVTGKILMVVLIWLAVRYDWGFLQLIWAGLWNNIVVLLITIAFILPITKLKLVWDPKGWWQMIKENLPYGLSITLPAFYLHLGPVLLAHIRPEAVAEAEVGIYGVGLRIYELLILIPFSFMNSALPSIARSLKDQWRLNDILQNSLDFLLLLGFGIVAGGMVLSPELVSLVSKGAGFSASASVLALLLIAMFFAFLNSLFSYLLLTLGKTKPLLIVNLLAMLVALGLCLVLIPLENFWGRYNGLAVANAAAQVVVLLGAFYFVPRENREKLKYGNGVKALLAALVMGATVYYLSHSFFSSWGKIKLLPLTLIGALLYLLLLSWWRAIPPQAWEIVTGYLPWKSKKQEVTVEIPRARRIAIDVRAIAGDLTGKEWYALSVLQTLGQIDQVNQYYLYTKYRFPYKFPNNFKIIRHRCPLIFWHLWMFASLLVHRVDILFAPTSYIVPALNIFKKRIRTIVVVHDTVAFLFPKDHQNKARWVEKLTGSLALKHASQIVAVSENTKQDLLKLFTKLDEKKVLVIGEAARQSFRIIESKDELKRVCNKYEIPPKFILFVGTLEPRKNLVRLIKAYALLKEGIRNTYKLVIAGRKGWYYKEIFETVRECKLEDNVIFTGYVPDEDLPYILNAATLFVMPSLYEGFGLPLLEAFACGTPVVSSATGALKEVAFDAALTFDPQDELALADALRQGVEDKDLRTALQAKGFERLKLYSWQKVAETLKGLFET